MAIDDQRRLPPPGVGGPPGVRPLVTPRLRLRPVRAADAEAVVALHGDPEVMRHLGTGRPVPADVVRGRDLPRLLSHHGPSPLGYWAAEDRATDGFVGWFELRPLAAHPPGAVELGYRLRRSAWGRGLATEGARALVDQVFTGTCADEVVATTMAVNTASRRVMEKIGLSWRRTYTAEAAELLGQLLPGAEQGEVEYALSRADWQPRPVRPFSRRQPRERRRPGWGARRS